MILHKDIADTALRKAIRHKKLRLGGNITMKIFGTLQCPSGKRLLRKNRIFFNSWEEALFMGFRPCGHCLAADYKKWKMDLSGNETNRNLLPCDGIVNYLGKVMAPSAAEAFFSALLRNIPWANDEVVIFGKRIITKRKMAWYGDDAYTYVYSHTSHDALPWTKELLELKQIAESLTGANFNSCLLNLYHDGNEGMSWHSDDEKSLAPASPIASLSFGAERKFSFRHKKTGQTLSLLLEEGSLLEMKGDTQKHWLHALPKSKKIQKARINLTFRTMQA